MKKILQVNKFYHPHIGGIETVVKYLAENLNDKNNWQTEVLVCQKKGPRKIEYINNVKVFKAKTLGIFLRMPISLDFFFLFKKMAREADLIVLHHPFPLAFLAYFLLSRKPMVIWYHSDVVKQKITGFLFYPLLNKTLKRADIILVSNQAIIKNSRFLKGFANKCHIIPYGLKIDHLLEKKKKDKIIKDKLLVLSIGRLVYYKGFEYLIEAFKDITAANLLIIGSGPLEKKLRNLIVENDLQAKVSIISEVSDLTPYYQSADLFVLSSVAESEVFGLVQIEALAAGLPVINTSLPTGVPEVSLNNQTGYTVEPKNSPALAGAIKRIIKDPKLREKFSSEATRQAIDRFSYQKFITANKECFENVLSKK